MNSRKAKDELIAEERKALIEMRGARLKYREISKLTKVSEGTLCRLHNGKISVTEEIAKRILKAYAKWMDAA